MLSQIRELITKGWCQGVMARNHRGQVCDPRDSEATCFCLHGAILASNLSENDRSRIIVAFDKLHPGFMRWQDYFSRTKEEVLEFLDNAEELINAGKV